MSLFTRLKKLKDTAERVGDFTGRLGDGSISDDTRTEVIKDDARLQPRIPRIDTIKANLNTGLASPARYAVLISTPQSLTTDASFLTFRTQNVSLPGKSLLTSEAKPKGFGQVVRYPYQNLFGQMEMTFITDEDYKEYKYFSAWMDSIVKGPNNKNRSTPGFDLVSYRRSYNCLISIFTYRQDGTISYTNFIADAYPRDVTPVQLGWENQSQLLTFNVIFEYSHHYDETTKDFLDGVPNLLGGINSENVSQVTNLLDAAFGAFGIDTQIPQDIRDISSVFNGGLKFL